MTLTEFLAWAVRTNTQRCIVCVFRYQYEDSGAPATGILYFSDRVYFDHSAETIIPYIDVINDKGVPQYLRSLSGDRLGAFTSSVGTLEFDNADGALDFIFDLAIDGSQCDFYVGDTSWPFTDFQLIFSCFAKLAKATSFQRVSVVLSDTGLLLNKSIGGTALVAGTGPQANQPRPFNFGYIHNLTPIIFDPLTGGGIYVYDDVGTDRNIDAGAGGVRDDGEPVGYTDNGDGTLTLTTGAIGTVTCDVLSDPGSAGRLTSNCFDEVIGNRCGLTAASKYDGPHRTFVPGDADDYPLGVSISQSQNAIQLLTLIVDSGNCSWAISRLGNFTYLRLRPNDIASLVGLGSPPLAAVDIYEDDLLNKGNIKLDHSTPLYWQYQAYMSKNWTVQTSGLATSLTADEQGVWSRKGIYKLQDPPGLGTTYNDSPQSYNKSLVTSPIVETLLSGALDELDLPFLETWMDTRRDTFLPWIEIMSITVGLEFFQLEIGDPVNMITTRFGQDSGTLFQVISINIRLSDWEIDLQIVRRRLLAAPPETWLRVSDPIDSPPWPSELGKTTLPPPPTVEPPPIRPPGTTGIGIDRSTGDPIFRPVYIGGGSRFFRPPTPEPEGFIIMEPLYVRLGSEGDPSVAYPIWYLSDSTGTPSSVSMGFRLVYQPSIQSYYDSLVLPSLGSDVNLVACDLAVFDTDNKCEHSGSLATGYTDYFGGPFTASVFLGNAIAVPAYATDLLFPLQVDEYKFSSGGGSDATPGFDPATGVARTPTTIGGIIYNPANAGGFFSYTENSGAPKMRSLRFRANNVDYIAYIVASGAGTGAAITVGLTTNPDVRSPISGGALPPLNAMGNPGVTAWSGVTWALSEYRQPFNRLPANATVPVSGPTITSPFSGFEVPTTLGTTTVSVVEGVPANDNFAAPFNLTLGPVTNQIVTAFIPNENATTEGSEPCGVGTATKTIWFGFKPGANGNISLDTLGSFRSDDGSYSNPLNTVLTVYTGAAIGSLTQIQTNDDGGTDVTSAISSFAVTSGTQYWVQVSSKSGTSQFGGIRLRYTCNFAMAPPPPVIASGQGFTGVHGVAITPFTPSVTNSPTSWADVSALISQPTLASLGFTLNTSTGQITGTKASAGSGIFALTATNAGGTSSPQGLSYVIS